MGGGGVSGFLTSRGKANVLTRGTAILGGMFFATSLALAILARPTDARRSLFDSPQTEAPAAPQPAAPQAPLSK
jgi:preprotein translocase subunit SecG